MSKFDGILSVKKGNEVTSLPKPAKISVKKAKKDKIKPVGKRSHPDYTQITAYIKKDTHEDVMRKIYKQQEFSELLQNLLTDWLKKNG